MSNLISLTKRLSLLFFILWDSSTCFAQNNKLNKRTINLYLTSGLVDPTVKDFMDKNNIGLVKLVGQADIDPDNDLIINEDLLRKQIKKLFPNAHEKGICALNWEGKAMKVLHNPQSPMYKIVTSRFIKVIHIARELRPNVQWGFYGLPFREYWNMDDRWRKNSEMLIPILSSCNIIFPSVYMLYTDNQVRLGANEEYIRGNVRMALIIGKEINKPVMPFVWHRLPRNNRRFSMAMIPDERFVRYIDSILSVTYRGKSISGIVWWGAEEYFYRMRAGEQEKRGMKESDFLQKINRYILDNSDRIITKMDSMQN